MLMTAVAATMIVVGVAAFCTGFCLSHDAAVLDWHIEQHKERKG